MRGALSAARRSGVPPAGRATLVVVVTVLLAACGSSSEDGSETTPTVADRTTTSVEFYGSNELCPTDEQCAESLYWAWIAGDRSRAAGMATPEAVESLFANSYDPSDNWQYNGCDGAAGSTGCRWTDKSGRSLMMVMSSGLADPDPSPPPPPFEVRSASIS